MSKTVKLAVTMGDPGGIGPEIALKAVYHSKWPDAIRFILIGSKNVWLKYASKLHLPLPCESRNIEETDYNKISIWDPIPCATVIPDMSRSRKRIGTDRESRERMNPVWIPASAGMTNQDCHSIVKWRPGKTGRPEGLASLLWIRAAVTGCQSGAFNGMITAPICKSSIQAAGCKFPGHTEYLAHLAGCKKVAMMLIGERLRIVLVTRHIPLASVAKTLTRHKIIETVEMADLGIKWLNLPQKTIGVCALNPHAGDGGLLGDEENKLITPAVKQLRREGFKIKGPIPADVIFYQAMRNKFGAVVAMYHDQGLGPLKMIAFENGVNLTLGLPFVRTSPDHGTAFDIAGKGIASCSSMVSAIKLAIQLAQRPNPWRR
ncbi:MAG: 4-hydroxythreonine-4-phosphate dehydrogenase PdxA [Kiritimatiellia bacterium]|nr:4-hydroxythreonine-4-phosphate dehydrogenase PdxA [Kiritimatiellia bacterium]